MLRPTRDLPFGAGHEQAKHAMDQMSANNKQKNSDNREMLKERAQAPETLQLSQDHGGNAPTRFKRLARDAPHLSLDAGDKQACNSGLHQRCDSMPHATFGHDML